MVPLVFITLARPGAHHHYANLILFLSACICVVGAAFYFLLVFGATMAPPLFETQPPAPILFLSLARSFIFDIGAHSFFDVGACNIIGIGVAFFFDNGAHIFFDFGARKYFGLLRTILFEIWRMLVIRPLAAEPSSAGFLGLDSWISRAGCACCQRDHGLGIPLGRLL